MRFECITHTKCLPWPQRCSHRLRDKRMGVKNHALQCLDNELCVCSSVCVCVCVCMCIRIEGACGFSSHRLNDFHSFSV